MSQTDEITQIESQIHSSTEKEKNRRRVNETNRHRERESVRGLRREW